MRPPSFEEPLCVLEPGGTRVGSCPGVEKAVPRRDLIQLSGILAHSPVGCDLERVRLTFAVRLDDSLQVLHAPPLVALRLFAEIAVSPLSFWSSSHFLNPPCNPHSAPHCSPVMTE